eukprot:3898299-Prorocentrum_lima.AAC.1
MSTRSVPTSSHGRRKHHPRCPSEMSSVPRYREAASAPPRSFNSCRPSSPSCCCCWRSLVVGA